MWCSKNSDGERYGSAHSSKKELFSTQSCSSDPFLLELLKNGYSFLTQHNGVILEPFRDAQQYLLWSWCGSLIKYSKDGVRKHCPWLMLGNKPFLWSFLIFYLTLHKTETSGTVESIAYCTLKGRKIWNSAWGKVRIFLSYIWVPPCIYYYWNLGSLIVLNLK